MFGTCVDHQTANYDSKDMYLHNNEIILCVHMKSLVMRLDTHKEPGYEARHP